MEKTKSSFLIHLDYETLLEDLTLEDKGVLLEAMFAYSSNKPLPKMKSLTKMAFKFIKRQMDYDNDKWLRKCKKNKENAEARYKTKGKEDMPYDATASDGTQTDATNADKDKEERVKSKENGIKKKEESIKNNEIVRLVQKLYDSIVANGITYVVNNPPNLNNWYKDMELLHRVDKVSLDDIEKAISYATSDTFWKANILSASKLRKQYPTLEAQMKTRRAGYQNGKDFSDKFDEVFGGANG